MADEIKREPDDLAADVARRPEAVLQRRQAAKMAEATSLDQVQRALITALIVVVIAAPAVVLNLFVIRSQGLSRSDELGLWSMSGVTGLIAAGAILVVNRRKPWSPFVLLGLLPMAVAAYWLF